MLFLLAMVLTGSSASWGQTQNIVFDTTKDGDGSGFSYDMDQGKLWYKKNVANVGEVVVEFPLNARASDNCLAFNQGNEAYVTAPSGYVITYAKVDFCQNYTFNINFGLSGTTDQIDNQTRNYAEYSYTGANRINRIRIANRASMGSSDLHVKSVTVRLHKAPTVSVASDKTVWTTLNGEVNLTASVAGEPGVFSDWHLYSSADATSPVDGNWLTNSGSFKFTPSTGFKTKDNVEHKTTSDYNDYYIGVRAGQNCIGGNGYEFSAPQIYTVKVGVKVSVNTSPANLTNDFTIHQRNEPTWVIDNGQIVGRYTTAVFTAPNVPGYTFDGWYEGSTKKSGQQTEYDYGNVGSDLTLTAKYTPITHPTNLTCKNNKLDLTKMCAYGNSSFNGSNGQGSMNADGAYLSIKFAESIDLHDLSSFVINGTNVEKSGSAGAFNLLKFVCEEGEVNKYTNPANASGFDSQVSTTDTRKQSELLAKCQEIRLYSGDGHQGSFTINSITLNYGGEHAKKPTPTFKDVTATNMVVVEGYDLKLAVNESGAIWREYTDGTFANQTYGNIAANVYGNSVTTISKDKLTVGQTYYFAAEITPTQCTAFNEYHGSDLAKVTVKVINDINLADVLSGMNEIYQPVYGQTYDGIAKEYLPFANITVPATADTDPADPNRTISDNLTVSDASVATLTKSFTDEGTGSDTKRFVNIYRSGKAGEMIDIKSKNAYILGNNYAWDDTKGMAISHAGAAGMPAYTNGTGEFPTNGVIAMKVQGTFDVTALLQNDLPNDERRIIKVYYTNDQLDGRLKEWKTWNFNGTRNETNANGYNVLEVNVRLAQLGQNGTCTLFFTYESNVADDNVWVKGFIIKRPDLKVTIGRTDNYGIKLNDDGTPVTDAQGNYVIKDGFEAKNVFVSAFGLDNPYQWNFGKSSFTNTKESDIEKKKVNKYDGRTYICAVDGLKNEEIMDHLLVYSDGKGDDKVTFDGRPSNGRHKGYEDDLSDMNEHIEFNHPTKYSGTHASGAAQVGFDGDRRSFTPILSNGLKVNVTGSGWFTIACTAPNGPVNMKVLSSTNGGTSYINLLREFRVEPWTIEPNPKKETDWQIFKVYLKAHVEKDGDKGFWDGNLNSAVTITDPEQTQMSLYIVFDAIPGETYKDNGQTEIDGKTVDAQLNIHFLQWVNEMPTDYVFQREEDPRLLSTEQVIFDKNNTDEAVLYWQAGTSKVEGNNSITPDRYDPNKEPVNEQKYASAFHSAKEQNQPNGQNSGHNTVSQRLDCEWNVAAEAHTIAHTEVDYAGIGKEPNPSVFGNFNNAYNLETAKSTIAENSSRNLEFAIPMSGSFFRFMPMKNQFISAYIVPETGKTAKIFVLDETGKPIPFDKGADMLDNSNGHDNRKDITQEGLERGWIHAAAGCVENDNNNYTGYLTNAANTAVRIDFAALAGKEYFIVSNDAKISLARLKVTDNAWRADVAAIDDGSTPALTLYDGNATGYIVDCNTTAINTAKTAKKPDYTSDNVYARYAKKVQLNREFDANKWVSLVLPFSMNEKKFKEVFGETAQCVHFTDVDKTKNIVTLTHHFYNMIVAGRPVFIKPSKAVNNPVITDVTLMVTNASTITNTTTPSGLQFVGSYDNVHMNKHDLYLNNSNEFRYLAVEAGATYPGLRSWIKNGQYDPSVAPTTNTPVAMFLNFDDADMGEATAIESIMADEFGQNTILVTKSTKVYDLNGRVVANGTDISNLPSGVYIVNGKKYVK